MVNAGFGGVFLGGNYVAGVALGKCVEYAYEYAEGIAKYLDSQGSTSGALIGGRRERNLLCLGVQVLVQSHI